MFPEVVTGELPTDNVVEFIPTEETEPPEPPVIEAERGRYGNGGISAEVATETTPEDPFKIPVNVPNVVVPETLKFWGTVVFAFNERF